MASTLMAVADFNRDGKIDIVVANTNDRTLTLLMGDGAGHFTQAPGSPMPGFIFGAIATGDVNGDGDPDLVVTGVASGTEILLGDGTGGFTKGTGITGSYSGSSGTLLSLADFNGDGKLDLVLSGLVFLGDGTGAFTLAKSSVGVNGSSDVVVGDFNGDGRLDLAGVSTVEAGSIAVVLGDGTGGFSLAFEQQLSSYFAMWGTAAGGDFHGTGKADILTLNAGVAFESLIWSWTGNTSALNLAFSFSSSYAPNEPGVVVTGDFNGDGKLDWATVEQNAGTATVWLGDGTGMFTAAPGSPYIVGGTPFAITVGDFNGDGKPDLAVDTGSNVVILLNSVSPATGLQTQAIQFVAPSYQYFTSAPFLIAATASSGLPVSFTSVTPSVCTVAANAVTFVGVGSCSITATQPGNGTYSAATPVTQSFNVLQAQQTISVPKVSDQLLGSPPFTLAATATSGLPVSYTAQRPTVCTVSGNVVTLVGSGVCALIASQPGSVNYLAAQLVLVQFNVLLSQTITFGPLPNLPLGSSQFTVNATASSGLAVAFASTTSACQILGESTVSVVATGTCSITATQAGNATYAAAPPVTQSFTVTPAGPSAQSISFIGPPGNQGIGVTLQLSATSTSGLPVTFTSNTLSICTISGNSVTMIAAGNCSITATQAGNATYAAAPPVTQSFSITPAARTAQSISFIGPPGNQGIGVTLQLSATSSSGLPVTFTANTPSICTISGDSVTAIAAGTCSITAMQTGNSSYLAAVPVTQSFTIIPNIKSQSISFVFVQPGGTLMIGAVFPLSAAASSGLPVTFTSNSPAVCSVSGASATMLAAGTCSLTASQAGNSTYAAAAPVTETVPVLSPSLATQTIAFGPLGNQMLALGSFSLSATASSGLPVSFASATPAVCTVSGTTVTLVSAGACAITATQAGNGAYNAAPPVGQTFTVQGQLQPQISSVANSASYFSGPLPADSYADVFGSNLAAQTGDPSVTVTIKDAGGNQVPAGVLYATAGQVNILVPNGLALGAGTLTLSNSLGNSSFGIAVGAIAPGLFTVDAAGTMPAAQVVGAGPNNTQVVQPVANCTAAGCVLQPIVLSTTGQTYLILYGTGIRGIGSLLDIAVTIGGVPAVVSYAGPQGGYPGLDQVNVLLPAALAGRGQISLQLAIFNTAANPVQLLFQ